MTRSLIALILQDSNNQDQIKSIEYDLSKKKIIIPSYIAAQPNELFMWRYNLITTNLSTSEKKPLGSDYSYTREDLVENTVIFEINCEEFVCKLKEEVFQASFQRLN